MDAEMTPAEAIKTIAQLRTAYEEHGPALAGVKEAVDDLKGAVKSLQEEHNRSTMAPVHLPTDAGIARYIEPDGRGGRRLRALGGTIRDTKHPHVGAYQPGILDDTVTHGDWHSELKGLVHQRNWVRSFSKHGRSPTVDLALARHLEAGPAPIRKLFADADNQGAEWIPTVHLPRLEEDLRMARRTEALFESMPMNDHKVEIPYLTTGLRPYIKGRPVTSPAGQYPASSLVTDKISVTATGFAVRAEIDEDASEDAILAWEPIMRRELVAAIVDGTNDAIVNGDTAASHQDAIASWDPRSRWGASGLGTASDHRRAWIGLRARAADVDNTTDHASLTYAKVLEARANLDSPHGVEGDVVLIASPEVYLASILGLDQVATLEKYGAQASVLSGEVARIGGMRIVVDEFLTSDLADSGLYTGTGTKTGFLVANRRRFIMGVRRGATVEMDKDITNGVIQQVATVRKVFFTVDSSTKKNVHFSYNL